MMRGKDVLFRLSEISTERKFERLIFEIDLFNLTQSTGLKYTPIRHKIIQSKQETLYAFLPLVSQYHNVYRTLERWTAIYEVALIFQNYFIIYLKVVLQILFFIYQYKYSNCNEILQSLKGFGCFWIFISRNFVFGLSKNPCRSF